MDDPYGGVQLIQSDESPSLVELSVPMFTPIRFDPDVVDAQLELEAMPMLQTGKVFVAPMLFVPIPVVAC